MSATTRRWVAGIGAAVALVAATAAWLGRAAPVGEGRPGAERVRATREDLTSSVKATGVVKPMVGAEVRVGSRASGVVKRLLVRVGDAVAAGQLLAELDARDLEARRDQAAAALASARASLDYARADLDRKRRLAAERLLAPSELDLATRAFALAGTQLEEAAASLSLVITQLGYARITAPIAGVVASVSTQEGETVAASLSSPTFVTLVDLSRLEVWAYVDETDIGRIQPGQDVRFTVDTYPGHDFEGRVTAVYPKAEIRDNVVNYVTVVRFASSPGHVLRPEMTATARIALETRRGVLMLPRRAVRRDGGATYVLVAEGERAVRRIVTTGRGDETRSEIASGLREGEEVVAGDAEGADPVPTR